SRVVPDRSDGAVVSDRYARRRDRAPGSEALVRRGYPLPKDHLEDPAMAHVLEVGRIVDARERGEGGLPSVRRSRLDLDLRARREPIEPPDRERLLAGEAK